MLRDFQWAQHCLFLFFRLQDDVFDGQSRAPSDIYLSHACLWEAEEIFSSHFPRSPDFWRVFRNCMRKTTSSILKVDALQRNHSAGARALLPLYAGVDSVFKIGLFAACLRCRCLQIFGTVERIVEELAIGNQILDDLADVREDMERGRLNYAARLLLGSGHAGRRITDSLIRRAMRSLYLTNRGSAIIDEAARHFSSAAEYMLTLGIRDMEEFSLRHELAVERIRTQLHRRTMNMIRKALAS